MEHTFGRVVVVHLGDEFSPGDRDGGITDEEGDGVVFVTAGTGDLGDGPVSVFALVGGDVENVVYGAGCVEGETSGDVSAVDRVGCDGEGGGEG